MSNVKIFDGGSFEKEVVQAQGPIMVDVWAPWCAPCNAMTPVIDEVSREFNVGKLNMDENLELCKKYDVSAIPTFLFFKNGKVMNRLVGIQSGSNLKRIMQELEG